MRPKTCYGLLAAALTLLTLPAWAEVQPQGRELRVNRRTDFKQLSPAAAFSPAGGALVVWENDQRGIRGLFYGTNGWPAGPELTLVESQSPTTIPYDGPVVNRRQPALAFFANGQFLLAWTEESADLRVSFFYERRKIQDQDILVQRFSASGAPLGEKVRVNTGAGLQREPRLIARNGGFLAVWEDAATGGIVGRALNGDGQPIGAEIKISERSGKAPVLAANAQGKVLVVWEGTDDSLTGVFARLLDAAANPVGPEIRVNTTTADRQGRPTVAADKTGNFLVAWEGEQTQIYRGFFYLYGQAVGAAGNLVGPQIRLYRGSLAGDYPQIAPALAAMPSGHFLLTWLSWRTANEFQAASMELDALGAPVGDAFWITEHRVLRTFRDFAVTGNSSGNFFVFWETVNNDRQGIDARRLSAK